MAVFLLGHMPWLWAGTNAPVEKEVEQTLAIISDSTEFPLDIIQYSKYIEDPSGELTLQDVLTSNFDWHSSTSNSINFGLTRTPAWIKFNIKAKSLPNEKLYLEIPFPVIDLIDVYFLKENTLVNEIHTGDLLHFSQRPVEHRNFIIPIELETNRNYQVYARFYVDGSLQLNATLLTASDLWKKTQFNNLIEDMYYGILFAMIFYNLFFFFATREISYIYYSGYVISFALFNATLRGYGYQYLWPNAIEWNGTAIPVTICLSTAFMSFFSAFFLRLDNRLPWVYSFFRACGICALALTISTPFFPKIATILVGGLLVLIVCCVALSVSWYLLLTGYQVARYFCMALTAFLFSALILVLNKFGFVNSNFFTEYAAQIGSALEAILLSFAQADKMQAEKRALFNAKKDALKRSNQLKDEFLATISHEFRTPMNGVIGCIYLAQKAKTKAESDSILKGAHSSALNLHHLLDNVLLYSEALSGSLKPDPHITSIHQWLDKVLAPFAESASKQALTFEKSISNELPFHLNIDERRLRQIIEHILLNALKFTETGRISVSVDYQHKSHQLEFVVTDTGIGMTQEQLNQMFQLFQQADGSHHRKYGGLGVGTALCKKLIEAMGGNINVKSEFGKGTAVTITLPAEAAISPQDNQSTQSFTPADKTILIVEDNPVNTLVLTKLLSNKGFNVICAENGKVGVDKVEDNNIDLILMDCQMPVMDGFEAVQIIRKLPSKKSQTPIIAVTANTMSKDKDHCLEVGMNDYVPKPIKNEELEQKIHHWLSMSA